jgi:DNA-binding transcriptional ArsR family regulator
MSASTIPIRPQAAASANAAIFAALGDETRLTLVDRLIAGEPLSIARLTDGTGLTRQAVTKHLKVLEGVGVVRALRAGRESRYALDPAPIAEANRYLEAVSRQWDDTLGRLKAFVEKG